MARRLNLLSPKFVETIEKPGRYADGGGLYLQVAASRNGGVTKSWLFRYMRGHLSRTGNPTSREMGLGPLSTNKRDGFITTKEARDRAYRAREDLKAGIDPIESRQALRTARKLNEARSVTFSQCAAEYIESHKAGWKGDKHVKLWRGSLGRYTVGDKVENAYRRTDLFEKRRRLMADGAQYCASVPATSSKVVPMRSNA